MRYLSQRVKEETCPVIEVLFDTLSGLETHLVTHWSFNGFNVTNANSVILDFSLIDDLSGNVKVIKNLLETLFKNGVNAIPAVQENSPANYIAMVKGLTISYGCKICIRTSATSGGFLNYNVSINALTTGLGITPGNTILLIDLGYAEAHNYNLLAALAQSIIGGIPHINHWNQIVIASGSFPDNLSLLPVQAHPQYLHRYEWDIWLAIASLVSQHTNIKYSDFGTKHPFFSDVSFPGSCSLKYASVNKYVIYRGELAGSHIHGNGQFITHAQKLIRTADYSGHAFSWGDLRISEIAAQNVADPNKKPGSLETWVQISQNHHITLLHSLL